MNVIISADDQGHNSVSCVSGPCIMRYEVVWVICRDQKLIMRQSRKLVIEKDFVFVTCS